MQDFVSVFLCFYSNNNVVFLSNANNNAFWNINFSGSAASIILTRI